jgi:hypothetical protein
MSTEPPTAAASSGPSGRPAQRADLLGAWTLVSYTVTDETTGAITHPLGPDAVGLIIYSPDGYMSAQLVRTQPAGPTPTDAGSDLITSAGQLAYSGPFTVDGTTGWVAHRLSVSSLADWLNTTQHRRSTVHDDQLTLTFTRTDTAGHRHTSTLTWQRLKPQTPR